VALDFYYGSGSPFAWRVWLALEHKAIPYTFKLMSFDAGDVETPAFKAINPRQKVPTIVDDGFALYESSAIVEYLEDKKPGTASLFSADIRERATQRRLIRETDDYFFKPLREIFETVSEKKPADRVAAGVEKARAEMAHWAKLPAGDYLAGALSAADFTLYPFVALVDRFTQRNSQAIPVDLLPPRLKEWAARLQKLAIVQKTQPPHWK
jgi:glutathione S-transferase